MNMVLDENNDRAPLWVGKVTALVSPWRWLIRDEQGNTVLDIQAVKGDRQYREKLTRVVLVVEQLLNEVDPATIWGVVHGQMTTNAASVVQAAVESGKRDAAELAVEMSSRREQTPPELVKRFEEKHRGS